MIIYPLPQEPKIDSVWDKFGRRWDKEQGVWVHGGEFAVYADLLQAYGPLTDEKIVKGDEFWSEDGKCWIADENALLGEHEKISLQDAGGMYGMLNRIPPYDK